MTINTFFVMANVFVFHLEIRYVNSTQNQSECHTNTCNQLKLKVLLYVERNLSRSSRRYHGSSKSFRFFPDSTTNFEFIIA